VSVEVTPVSSRSDLREFIELPYRLHSNAEGWIPPLRLERRAFLHPRLNAYFKHGEAQLFVARRDGRVAGRISAQIDTAFNDFHDNAWGMFGFLELEDDAELMSALLDAAAGWLAERGRDRMIGPMDFTMNDESGVLIEGYERPAMVRQPWHPPYYRALCEAVGLEKATDLFMWELHISDRERVLPIIWELADQLEPKHGIRIRKMSRRRLRRELDAFAEIYNEAWSRNWGFVPYSKADLDAYAQELQLVYDRDWFMVAEDGDGKTVGVAISVPDINQVLKRMDGRVLPLGWWHYLNRRRIVDRVRVGFLGVRPAYQHTGVAAGLYAEHFRMAEVTRIKGGEMGWILESNKAMNRAMAAMGGRIVKRFRVYERGLDDPHPAQPAEPAASMMPHPAQPAEPAASVMPNPAQPAEPAASGLG
jgi:GNAT superfamily N-acetyltransferase